MASNLLRRGVGRIDPKTSSLFLCDMQEKFRPMIAYFDQIVHNSNRVLGAAKIMDLPVFATEQYPKGLGRTVRELEVAKHGVVPHEKTCFTMCLPKIMEEVEAAGTRSVVLCGIETHACIHHTTLDLLEKGLDVHVVVDCCSSR